MKKKLSFSGTYHISCCCKVYRGSFMFSKSNLKRNRLSLSGTQVIFHCWKIYRNRCVSLYSIKLIWKKQWLFLSSIRVIFPYYKLCGMRGVDLYSLYLNLNKTAIVSFWYTHFSVLKFVIIYSKTFFSCMYLLHCILIDPIWYRDKLYYIYFTSM